MTAMSVAYYLCYRRARGEVRPVQAWCFGMGIAVWALATLSVVGAYAPVLFWVRALQVVLLLYLAPFLLALGRPVATVRAAVSEPARERIDLVMGSRVARVLFSPPVTSVLMLATPWLLYLTRWYVASMVSDALGEVTRLLLLLIGFSYFYTRLQCDPVPRRYTPLLSIGVSVAEGLGDGLLGLVLWLGPVIAYDYYAGLGRGWGPSVRDDQTLGAGILWILGDVIGIPFVVMLMRALGSHERTHAAEVDAAQDALEEEQVETGSARLWWESDPQIRDRFHR